MDFENEKFRKIFFEIYEHLPRGGPGDAESTGKAFALIKNLSGHPEILDVGCGPGRQTLDLARISPGKIVAVDNHLPFLERLKAAAQRAGLQERVRVEEADMFHLPFEKEAFDLIWSEGAIYNLGFENGLRILGAFLKPGGYLAVSEAVWLKKHPPKELKAKWDEEYPAITDIPENLTMIGKCGYVLLGNFTLPKSSWMDDFYTPMEARIVEVKKRYQHDQEVMDMMPYFQNEIEIY
ncbi:methyltransferase domain-containing protein, partial [bacterium]|nr:methyltransferase domain-containing protein [bacterium]